MLKSFFFFFKSNFQNMQHGLELDKCTYYVYKPFIDRVNILRKKKKQKNKEAKY